MDTSGIEQGTGLAGPRQTDVFSSARLPTQPRPESLADVLERVLDKGIVIVGDIQVRLLDIELLTIKLRLLIASVDKAREMGVTWWETDEFSGVQLDGDGDEERSALDRRVQALEERIGTDGDEPNDSSGRSRAETRGS
jgi:hypothetical protein